MQRIIVLIIIFFSLALADQEIMMYNQDNISLGQSICMKIQNRYPITFNYTLQLFRDNQVIDQAIGQEWFHLNGDSATLGDYSISLFNDYGRPIHLLINDHTCPAKTIYLTVAGGVTMLITLIIIVLIFHYRRRKGELINLEDIPEIF